jgi:hypothetical protein
MNKPELEATVMDFDRMLVQISEMRQEIARLRAALDEIRTLPGSAAEVGTLAPTIATKALKGRLV